VTHKQRRFQFRLVNHLFRVVPGFMGKSRLNRWWSPSELETEIRSGTWAKRFHLWRLLSSCRAPLTRTWTLLCLHRVRVGPIYLIDVSSWDPVTPWPLHDIAITHIVWHVLQQMNCRGGTLHCAIVWAMKGRGGVPKQGGSLQISVLIRIHGPRAKRISFKSQVSPPPPYVLRRWDSG